MSHKSLRDEWKSAKSANKACDVSKVADKENFGPKLDKYEAACESYEKLMKVLVKNPDEKKEDAAKKAVIAAAKDASLAGAKYLQVVDQISKNGEGAEKKAAYNLATTLSMDILKPD